MPCEKGYNSAVRCLSIMGKEWKIKKLWRQHIFTLYIHDNCPRKCKWHPYVAPICPCLTFIFNSAPAVYVNMSKLQVCLHDRNKKLYSVTPCTVRYRSAARTDTKGAVEMRTKLDLSTLLRVYNRPTLRSPDKCWSIAFKTRCEKIDTIRNVSDHSTKNWLYAYCAAMDQCCEMNWWVYDVSCIDQKYDTQSEH